ncbi:pentapeptide repeat-containing protein [Saccharothrix sp. NPDC042600]|uniref:pentapeptide repeat-containing protein n=1 Tax=Saccharothrix TaxID=2071 RepID=UPI0033E8C6EF
MASQAWGRRPPVPRPDRDELAQLSAKDRYDLWDAHRHRPLHVATSLITSLGVLLGVAFTAFGLVYTARTLESAREGQLTDRYSKAVEQLASPAVEVRLGGIYALERLASDSPRDRPTVRDVLAAYLRNRDFCAPPPNPTCTASIRDMYVSSTTTPLATDLTAALTTALALTADGDDPLDLTGARFPRAQFPETARLRRVDLSSADLAFAAFGGDLSSSTFRNACLTYGRLHDVDLRGADLTGADLYHADLAGARLDGADLRGADLRKVFGKTPAEVRAVAKTDENTRFGDDTRPDPSHCGPRRPPEVELHAWPR